MALTVGKKAPSFRGLSDLGDKISLTDLKGKKVVLFFYPKDMTPGCTQEACDFQDNMARLKSKNVEVIGVSRDSIKSHEKFRTKHKLGYHLISDEDGKICESYGVWKEKSMYGRKYMGIERSTFVIDQDGKLAQIYAPVKVKDHVKQVLEFVSSL